MVLQVLPLSYYSADQNVQNELEKTSSSIHKKSTGMLILII